MWPLLIVLADPQIEIGLQLVDRTIHLLSEHDTVELIEHRFVEALANAVGLRALGLGARMIDVLDSKVKLVFVSLRVATILAAAVGQYAQKLDIMLFEERQHPIIEQICRRDRRLAIVKLSASDLGVGIDEGLLVDAANALQITDIERILGAAIAWMLALELTMGLLLSFGLFQRNDLRLSQHQAFLSALGLQRLKPFVHGLQVVAQPDAAHAGRRDGEPALSQFVGDPDLAESGLLDRERNDGVFDVLRHAVLQHRLLAADLLQCQLAPLS